LEEKKAAADERARIFEETGSFRAYKPITAEGKAAPKEEIVTRNGKNYRKVPGGYQEIKEEKT